MFASAVKLEELLKLKEFEINPRDEKRIIEAYVELTLGEIRRVYASARIIDFATAEPKDTRIKVSEGYELSVLERVNGITIEEVKIPQFYMGIISPTKRGVEIGVGITAIPLQQGYCGKVSFGLSNNTGANLKLAPDTPILRLYLTTTTDHPK